jgi:hypothetical protein
MTRLDPRIAVRPISHVAPGSLVQLGGMRGFCARSSRDPNETRSMVMYDPERASFLHRVTPAAVIDFGVDWIIVPNLRSVVEDLLPSSDASGELWLLGDSPSLVFRAGDNGPRLLDLKTGTIEPLQRGAGTTAFRTWTVGVNTAAAGYVTLLEVGPRPSLPFEPDEEPPEPYED